MSSILHKKQTITDILNALLTIKLNKDIVQCLIIIKVSINIIKYSMLLS